MPKFEKGSKEAKEYMQNLRSLKKGNGSSHSTHQVAPLPNNTIVVNATPYTPRDHLVSLQRGDNIIDLTNVVRNPRYTDGLIRTPANRRRNAIRPVETTLPIATSIGTGIKKIKIKKKN